ncbi:MAG: acyl-CoA mutase large subunit family protein [Alphaproteobacteria bacterium]|nr:acyl-CoA mutase large subunit family protein [Alphaproteobacteria bacterium]
MIQEETNITAVSDPLAGSYYVEALTDQMCNAALEFVEQIEKQGGYIAAQRSGWIRREIEGSAERWREMVNAGQRKVVGLNCYETDEAPQENIFKVDDEVERIAVERLAALRKARDAGAHGKALASFNKAASDFASAKVENLNGGELIEAAIEAARADATTGEMMGAMKDSLGWAAPHEY